MLQQEAAQPLQHLPSILILHINALRVKSHHSLPSHRRRYHACTRLPSILAPHEGKDTADAYAIRSDFGKSNLHKWSSVHGMDTSWDDNEVTDTVHLQSSTIAFLDTLNADARAADVSFVITGGAERGYHAHGMYSHENGYKIDISDDGVYAGTTAYRVLLEALAPYKHHLSHEWNNNHFDITIYPADYTGSYAGASHGIEDDDE